MDLTIKMKEKILNVRVAGIIVHNDKVLLHKNENDDFYALLGGRVKIGEDSEKALRREIMEELGKEIEIIDYMTTIENFFLLDGYECQEIMFVYKIDFKEDDDKKIEHTLSNAEGKEYLKYEWIELKNIEECNLQPKCMRELLKKEKCEIHRINFGM